MKTAILPGSFNPVTLGHLDIIQRAAKLADHLIVAIIDNPTKLPSIFSTDEKKDHLKTVCASIDNIGIVIFQGLLVDLVQKEQAECIIRGLRTSTDLEYENQMAVANKIMCGVETVFLPAAPEYGHLSSSLIREIGMLGHPLTDFVPPQLAETIYEKLSTYRKKT